MTSAPMTQIEIQRACAALLREHGLGSWTIGFDRSPSRLGSTSHRNSKITFSLRLLALVSREEAMDTVIHEVAHARVMPGRKPASKGKLGRWIHHGPEWRKIFIEMGGSGRTAISGLDRVVGGKYRVTCKSCDLLTYRDRWRKGAEFSCPRCGPSRYSPKYKLIVTVVATGERV